MSRLVSIVGYLLLSSIYASQGFLSPIVAGTSPRIVSSLTDRKGGIWMAKNSNDDNPLANLATQVTGFFDNLFKPKAPLKKESVEPVPKKKPRSGGPVAVVFGGKCNIA